MELLKINCSTEFLLPALGLDRKSLEKHGFIAAYTDDKGHEPHHKDAVYILFKPPSMTKFGYFLDLEYERVKQLKMEIIEDYDYHGGYVIIVYRFPEKYMNDFRIFQQGKYSKFSSDFRSLFPITVEIDIGGGRKERSYSLPYMIFSKEKALRKWWEEKIGVILDDDMELCRAPNGADILDIKKILTLSKL